MCDGSHGNWFREFEDFFQVLKSRPSNSLSGWMDGFQFTLTLNDFYWLTDLMLSNAHIVTNDLNSLVFSFGAKNQVLNSVDADGNPAFLQNTAIFSMDSLKLVSIDVPEASINNAYINGLLGGGYTRKANLRSVCLLQ